MLLFSVKPKLQLVQDNLRMSQSNEMTERMGVGSYRMKPKQFQKEEVNLFNIPQSDTPYRIPGTKIGIMSSEELNANGRKDEQQMSALLVQVQLAIDCMKRVSHASKNTEDYKYDALEITDDLMSVLSHRQQLQILNDLVNLRAAVKKMSSVDQRWVEVIQTTRSSLNQTLDEKYRRDTLSLDEANQTLAQVQDDAPGSPAMLSNQQQRQELQDEAAQTNGQLHLSKRPAPPKEEPPTSVLQRPLSPKGQAEAEAQTLSEKKLQAAQEIEAQRAVQAMENQAQQRRRTSRYRSIREFLENYESQYKQQLLKPGETKQRAPRDFIQENIDNQQYYKKGVTLRRPTDEFWFEQSVECDDSIMGELMMRVAMQQLCFRANNGDLEAYRRLVLLQERYKKLYEAQHQPAEAEDRRQRSELARSIRESVQQDAERNQAEAQRLAEAQRQREAIRKVLEEREAAKQKEQLTKKQKTQYQVTIPRFSKDHVKAIKAEQKRRFLEQEKHYIELARTADKNTVLINKRSPEFETLFAELCDSILFDIQTQAISTAVDSISAAVQLQ